MRRYLVFAGEEYESTSGGWDNLVSDNTGNNSFDTLDEAKALAVGNQEWSHVVDIHTGEKVFEWIKYPGREKSQIRIDSAG